MTNKDAILLTKEGIEDLRRELDKLINVERPKVIEELKEARAQGDLSENADYDAARNKQAEVEGRIKEIEGLLEKATEIKTNDAQKDEVKLGSVIKLRNMINDSVMELKILGAVEANPFEHSISNDSPIAKAILGRKVGEVIEVRGIPVPYKLEILAIE